MTWDDSILRLEGHIARLQRHTEELRNSLEGAHLVYSVDKFPRFLVRYIIYPSRIAKAGTSSTGVLTM